MMLDVTTICYRSWVIEYHQTNNGYWASAIRSRQWRLTQSQKFLAFYSCKGNAIDAALMRIRRLQSTSLANYRADYDADIVT